MVNHPNRSKMSAATSTRARASVGVMPRAPRVRHDHDADWNGLMAAVREAFADATPGPLFTTDAKDLFELYLGNLPSERLVHTCHACRRFIEAFGGLATINDQGALTPAVWPNVIAAPAFYRESIDAMAKAVRRARVTGVFLSSAPWWGQPKTGVWTHLAVKPRPAMVYASTKVLTADQAVAAKREDHNTVARALDDFAPPVLTEALRLFTEKHLPSSEKFEAPVRWLVERQLERSAPTTSRVRRDNLLWRAIATAPAGFCHPRASVLGPLFEDVARNKAFVEIRKAFADKVAPTAYQRPTEAPKAGNVARAEAIVEKLGIAASLERRYARLDEIEAIWTPRRHPPGLRTAEFARAGVFTHLAPKPDAVRPVDTPPVTTTWEKFARTVLPDAEAIDVLLDSRRMNFIALTTAVDPTAPPILKWDRVDPFDSAARNPFAWYLYDKGSPPAQWGLELGYASVSAITRLPTMWGARPMPNLGDGVILVLDGAADTALAGNALFPETLREELHEVRATIEAYAKTATLKGANTASACGLDLRNEPGPVRYRLRVTAKGRASEYVIDRWD